MKPKPTRKNAAELPKRPRVRLKSARDVARFQARCIRAALTGEGGTTKWYNLVNMSSQLLKAIEVSSLEERISKLEDKLERGQR
jgi:hypothetical protein